MTGEVHLAVQGPAGVAELGARLAVQWTPEGGQGNVNVWRLGPDGWHKEAAVAEGSGQFVWDTADDLVGWHAFATCGEAGTHVQAGGTVRLAAAHSPAAPDPSAPAETAATTVPLTLRGPGNVVSPLLLPELEVSWNASALPDARAEVALWAREDGGAWTRLTAQGELTADAGQFRWDITAVTPGRYTLTATLDGQFPPVTVTGGLDVEVL